MILQIMNQIDYCLKEKTKTKWDELGGKIMAKCAGLTAKSYSYLIDDSSDEKKSKATKK